MEQGFGIASSGGHAHTPHNRPARYLVIIDSGGSMVARLFQDSREPVAEFDAGTEEVASMTSGREPTRTAQLAEWDAALAGHSAAEREAAEVYTLDI